MSQPPADPATITAQYTTILKSCCDISESYYYLGRLDDALALLDTGAQIIAQREVLPRDRALLLLQRGKLRATTIFLADGDFEAALADLLQAQQIAEDLHDRGLLGNGLNLLGQAHYFNILNSGSQDWDTPQTYFQQALEQYQAVGDSAGTSDTLFHIGLMHERKAEYDVAGEYYQHVLDLTARHGHKRERSYAARHLAGIYQQRGDLEQARHYFEESLALRQEIGLKLYLPFAHIAVGDVLCDQGDYAGGLAHYQKAYNLSAEMGLKAGLISSLLSMGYTHKEQQALSQALEHFEQARAVAETIGFKRGIAAASAEIESITKQQLLQE